MIAIAVKQGNKALIEKCEDASLEGIAYFVHDHHRHQDGLNIISFAPADQFCRITDMGQLELRSN